MLITFVQNGKKHDLIDVSLFFKWLITHPKVLITSKKMLITWLRVLITFLGVSSIVALDRRFDAGLVWIVRLER